MEITIDLGWDMGTNDAAREKNQSCLKSLNVL